MKRAVVSTAILSLALTVAAVAAYSAFARTAKPSAIVKMHTVAAPRVAGVAPGVAELARRDGLAPGSLHTLATTTGADPAEIVGAVKGDSTCAYLTRGGAAAGGCQALDGQRVAPQVTIVDGKTYVWGLVASGVSSVAARVDGQGVSAEVGNGLFSAELPEGAHGTGPIALSVEGSDGPSTVTLPGIPAPIAHS